MIQVGLLEVLLLVVAMGAAAVCALFLRQRRELRAARGSATAASGLLRLVEAVFAQLSGVTERDEVARRLVAVLAEQIGAEVVALYELDRGRNRLCLREHVGGERLAQEIPATALHECIAARRPVVCADAGREATGLVGMQLLVAFPLTYSARVFGVGLLGTSALVREVGEPELAALGTIGRAAGFALAGSEQRERIWHNASHDLTTGLANRTLLHDEYELRRDQGGLERGAVLLMVGMPGFRDVNRLHGHYAGDRLLERIARRLETLCKDRPALAVRLGGAEFAIVAYQCGDADFARQLAAGALACFEEPFEVDGLSIPVTPVIGLAIAADNALDDREMLRRAEIAMSSALAAGAREAIYAEEQEAALRGAR
jgi:diguanylate cyclase (GGDEF)-like protein